MRKGLCDAKTYEACAAKHREYLDWACSKCESKRPEDLHPYTLKLLDLRALQLGGYPLEANDLTPEEWVDLGKVRQWLDRPILDGSSSK